MIIRIFIIGVDQWVGRCDDVPCFYVAGKSQNIRWPWQRKNAYAVAWSSAELKRYPSSDDARCAGVENHGICVGRLHCWTRLVCRDRSVGDA